MNYMTEMFNHCHTYKENGHNNTNFSSITVVYFQRSAHSTSHQCIRHILVFNSHHPHLLEKGYLSPC